SEFMKIDACVVHLIPPKVKVINDDKINFLLIGNIKRFNPTPVRAWFFRFSELFLFFTSK
ncbi:MAG TPA: hypothetical protein VLM39_08800, partial [Ignavibacteriaceae bacterium]|nr:hypothetical protein [Ignavibacteriaceae bacterium]